MAEKILDIRAIVLKKCFGIQKTKKHVPNWEVWGHYDTLEINDIHFSQDTIPPLQKMWEHANALSSALVGREKMHAQYALCFKEAAIIHSFWESAQTFPLLVISVVHAKHSEDKSVDPDEFLKQLDEEISNIVAENTSIQHMCYKSLDCCDAIIFWLCNVYSDVMSAIENLCYSKNALIQDIFSIQGFRSMTKQEQMVYGCLDASVPFAQFILRGRELEYLIAYANELHDRIVQTAESVFLLPGQDDITVLSHGIKTRTLIEIVTDPEMLSTKSLAEKDISCHTTLGFNTTKNSVPELQDKEQSKTDFYSKNNQKALTEVLFEQLNKQLCLLSTSKRNEVKHKSWYAAFCELLNQLCNMETSSTAHDIFTQEIYCQSRFVESVIYQLKSNLDSFINGQYDHEIQLYLHGWSQLTFHAMHSEWQLTQSFDSNRLYIYPAKLSLFYNAYMHKVTELLTCLDVQNSAEGQCAFFLTPKLSTDPRFLSVFHDTDEHTTLVLGEIPAELLFRPADLLPVLAHEAAHYVGRTIRNRKKRVISMMRSVALALVDYIALSNPLYVRLANKKRSEVLNALRPYIDELIAKVEKSCDVTEMRIESTIDLIDRMIATIIRDKHISRNIEYAIVTNFSDMELLRSDSSSYIPSKQAENIEESLPKAAISLYRNLTLLYREGFADLCMVHLLGMNSLQYLECLINMLKAFASDMNNDFDKVAYFERSIAIVKIICNNPNEKYVAEKLCHDLEQLNSRVSVDIALQKWIEEMICRLNGTNKNVQRIETHICDALYSYLNVCKKCLGGIQDNRYLRDLYRDFYERQESSDFEKIYRKCYAVTYEYIGNTREYLRAKYPSIPIF